MVVPKGIVFNPALMCFKARRQKATRSIGSVSSRSTDPGLRIEVCRSFPWPPEFFWGRFSWFQSRVCFEEFTLCQKDEAIGCLHGHVVYTPKWPWKIGQSTSAFRFDFPTVDDELFPSHVQGAVHPQAHGHAGQRAHHRLHQAQEQKLW